MKASGDVVLCLIKVIILKCTYLFNKRFFLTPAIVSLGFLVMGDASGSDKALKKNDENITSYSVGLGATRVIYRTDYKGVSLSVDNPNDYPVLVLSTVKNENYKENTPFTITPPLFRLEPHQQSKIKIIMTGEPDYNDRESLYWLCAMGIPPKKDDLWVNESAHIDKSSIDVTVRVSQCIKILVRPRSLNGSSDEAATSVKWSVVDRKLKADNTTKYYININSLSVDHVKIKSPDYIPPMSTKYYALPEGIVGKNLEWDVINDPGGVSTPIKVNLK